MSSQNVNFTNDEAITESGVDVELLCDYDAFTTNEPVESLDELIEHLQDLDEL